ncbi:hypothetical protein CDIK_4046, partial [Cucumispora dikerogammari]
MFNKIIITLNTCTSELNTPPIISTQPKLLIGKFEEIKSFDQQTVIPDKFQWIEAVVDFKDSLNLQRYTISEKEVIENMKILLIKDKENEKKNSGSFLNPSLSEGTFFDLSCIKKSFTQIPGTSQFVLSLRPANTETEHPLVNYLKDNPTTVCKLCLMFQGRVNNYNNEELIKIIQMVKTENLGFIEFCSNAFKKIIDEIKDSCLDDEKFIEILERQNISAEFKKEITFYLYMLKKKTVLEPVMFSDDGDDEGKKQKEDDFIKTWKKKRTLKLKIVKNLKNLLKDSFIDKLNNLNIHVIQKEKILQIFNEEIDNHNEQPWNFLNTFFAKLKEKTTEESSSV